MMKRADIILIISIFLIFGFMSIMFKSRSTGSLVKVYLNGELHSEYSLFDTRQVFIVSDNGENTFEIKNGTIKMIEADCRDKLCIKQNGIRKSKESIVCLPNKLLIEITGNYPDDIDAVAG